ncbi:MAG: alpha/beta hydrolase [Dehalococcoidia bacterium]|nr:alpha/beta hydrolase [Dehalococcoidia bacterium]
MATLALVHSPLTGPGTWAVLAPELTARGHTVAVADLADTGAPPYWPQHASSAAAAITSPAVLVLHSGAGPLAPAIVSTLAVSPAACIFLDAGLPQPGSRLDAFAREMGDAAAAAFRANLESGGRYPDWTDGLLAAQVPDPGVRAAILADLRPRPLDFWTERLDFAPDLDIPCAYLQLSPAYASSAAEARRRRWPTLALASHHFAMLTDPGIIATHLESLVTALPHQ